MNIFTICSANYLHKAYCLYFSLNEFNKEYKFNLFLTELDTIKNVKTIFKNANIFYLNDIYSEKKEIEELVSKYNVTELNTCIKACCFKNLFKSSDKVLYIDPDIEIFDELTELEFLLDEYNALLTPHCLTSYKDNLRPNFLDILSSGTNNFGFLGLKKTPETYKFVDWWDDQLFENCFNDISNGVFTDQKFGEFIPSFIKKSFVIHNPAYNVGYWNLHERKIEFKNEIFYVNGEELKFFHFSGIAKDIKYVSRHQDRIKIKKNSAIYRLFDQYTKKCLSYRKIFTDDLTNNFTNFDNGDKILEIHKTALRLSKKNLKLNSQNQLIYKEKTFYKISAIEINLSLTMKLVLECEPIIAAAIKLRPDLVLAFPFVSNSYPLQLKNWFINGGYKEFGLNKHGLSIEEMEKTSDLSKREFLFLNLIKIGRGSNTITNLLRKYLPNKVKYTIQNLITQTNAKEKKNSCENLIQNYNKRFSEYAIERKLKQLNIYYVGYLNYPNGLGKAARNLASELSKNGKLSKISFLKITGKKEIEIAVPKTNNLDTDATLLHCNFDMFNEEVKSFKWEGIKILYIVWEMPFFPREWIETLKYIDLLIVPSKFIADNLYLSYGIKSFVLPYIVNPIIPEKKYIESIKEKYSINNNIIFLISFDLDSYSSRKNPIAAINALEKALDNFENLDYTVIIKVHGESNEKNLNFLTNLNFKNKLIVNKSLKDKEYAALQELSNIYVSLHRSEGYGLNIAEMIKRGKYVVTTGFSGNVDFCDSEKSYLVKYKLVRVKSEDYPYSENGQYWAEPDVNDAAIKISEIIKILKEN